MRNKVCDVIFGHFLIIGLLLIVACVIGWGLVLPIPYKQIGVIGSGLVILALVYAQGDDGGVSVDGRDEG